MKNDIVIVGAARTPVGAFGGALSGLPATTAAKLRSSKRSARASLAPTCRR